MNYYNSPSFAATHFPQASVPTLLLCFVLMSIGQVDTTRKVEVHGHRGARARFPENTLPAFEYAIAEGVDVLELDMGVTKDDIVVVSHDPLLEAPVCTGPHNKAAIRRLTL